MWSCCFGEISEDYRNNWEPHTVSPDQKEPDVYDVLAWGKEIMYRLDTIAARECFTDEIQVDWGGWAYKVTRAQAIAYNDRTGWNNSYSIPRKAINLMEEGKTYGIINVELW